jgi:hypothetical protein
MIVYTYKTGAVEEVEDAPVPLSQVRVDRRPYVGWNRGTGAKWRNYTVVGDFGKVANWAASFTKKYKGMAPKVTVEETEVIGIAKATARRLAWWG